MVNKYDDYESKISNKDYFSSITDRINIPLWVLANKAKKWTNMQKVKWRWLQLRNACTRCAHILTHEYLHRQYILGLTCTHKHKHTRIYTRVHIHIHVYKDTYVNGSSSTHPHTHTRTIVISYICTCPHARTHARTQTKTRLETHGGCRRSNPYHTRYPTGSSIELQGAVVSCGFLQEVDGRSVWVAASVIG